MDQMMKGLVTKYDVDALRSAAQSPAVASDQFDRKLELIGGKLRPGERFTVDIDTNDALRLEGLCQQPERLALTAADIQDHQGVGVGLRHQSLEVIECHSQHVVFPRVGAQKPSTESSFRNECGGAMHRWASI